MTHSTSTGQPWAMWDEQANEPSTGSWQTLGLPAQQEGSLALSAPQTSPPYTMGCLCLDPGAQWQEGHWPQQTMACELEQVTYSLSLSFFLCKMGTMPTNNRVVWIKRDNSKHLCSIHSASGTALSALLHASTHLTPITQYLCTLSIKLGGSQENITIAIFIISRIYYREVEQRENKVTVITVSRHFTCIT